MKSVWYIIIYTFNDLTVYNQITNKSNCQRNIMENLMYQHTSIKVLLWVSVQHWRAYCTNTFTKTWQNSTVQGNSVIINRNSNKNQTETSRTLSQHRLQM